jgi:hypothetical protein
MEAKIEALLAQAESQQANGQAAQDTSDATEGDKADGSS